MRSVKGSHRIVVNGVLYRWRASGNDGYINVGIWPSNNVGPYIHGNFKYHESWNREVSCWSSVKDQIVITNRLVRRIIDYAVAHHDYDPDVQGTELNLRVLDDVIDWSDAIRATRRKN